MKASNSFIEAQACKTNSAVKKFLRDFKVVSIYSSGESYDVAYKGYTGDAKFYNNLVKKREKILYIGVGTGRIFAGMVKKSPFVYGIDKSRAMVDRMLKRYSYVPRKNLIINDILSANLDEGSYDKVVAPFSFFTQFSRNKAIAILKKSKSLLRPGGILYTDYFPANEVPKHKDVEVFRKPQRNGKKVFIIYSYLKRQKLLNEYTVISSKKQNIALELKLHAYSSSDIKKIFKEAGFKKIKIWYGFQNGLKSKKAESVVVRALNS